jgi:hypothetical protein
MGGNGNGGMNHQVNLEIDEETAKGIYSNFAVVSHTGSEFIIDFAFILPANPKNKIRSRVISSPQHTKRLFMALQDNISKYEEKFGKINI